MQAELVKIFSLVIGSLSKAWPFLLISIPFSVLIRVSGASAKINAGIAKQPIIGIFIATFFGALSPLCSCTVIPVIYSLLLAGVPLGPVMAFWIASPSMDPEMFFLSVSTLGWNLAIWRLAATFALSLIGGFLALALTKNNVFANGILRERPNLKMMRFDGLFKSLLRKIRSIRTSSPVPQGCGCSSSEQKQMFTPVVSTSSCCSNSAVKPLASASSCCNSSAAKPVASSCCGGAADGQAEKAVQKPLFQRIVKESIESVLFVSQFLVIAYILEAVIILYVPSSLVERAVGGTGILPIIGATFLGIPLYTTNMAALGILSGFLEKGMSQAAVLSFLIAGPTTTLPAMSAVFGITKPKVFALYLGIIFSGAVLFGLIYMMFGGV